MAKTELNPKVDAFLNKPSKWQAEFKTLREIAIGFELEEENSNGANLVMLLTAVTFS